VKAAVIEVDSKLSRRFKEEEDLAYDGGKPNPEDWSEYLQYDLDFQQEFNNIVNDPGISEADKDFTPDVFDDTYLNMELAIPKVDKEVLFSRPSWPKTKWLLVS
jgi:hypothetical protein